MHLKGNTTSKLENHVLYCKDVLYGLFLKCFVYNVQMCSKIWTCQVRRVSSKASSGALLYPNTYFTTLLRNISSSHPKMLTVNTTPSEYKPWVTKGFATGSIATLQTWQYRTVTHSLDTHPVVCVSSMYTFHTINLELGSHKGIRKEHDWVNIIRIIKCAAISITMNDVFVTTPELVGNSPQFQLENLKIPICRNGFH